MALVDVCRAVKRGVVAIGTRIDDNPVIIGTGFNVDPLGIVVTCRHVITGLLLEELPAAVIPPGKRFGRADVQGLKVFVMFHYVEGDQVAVEGVPPVFIIGPMKRDAAVIMLPKSETTYPWLTVGDSNEVLEGEAIATCGFPLGLALQKDSISGTSSFQAGIISAVLPHPEISSQYRVSLQLDMVVNPGNSGGPIFLQESGQVVGIVQSRQMEPILPQGQIVPTGLSYGIPINVVKPFIERIRQDPAGVAEALGRGELPEDLDVG